MRIILCRHGQTIFNKKRLLQGWCDSPLTEEGIEQAKKLGDYLKYQNIDFAFTSDLLRCHDTALYALKEDYIPLITSKQLREMNFGDKEGDPIDEGHRARFYTGYHEYNGENKEECGKRMMDYILSLYDEFKDNTIVIFSHGWSIRCFLRLIDEKRCDEYFENNARSKNCSVSSCDYDGKQFVIRQLFEDVLDS